jgi:hypothetical protein
MAKTHSSSLAIEGLKPKLVDIDLETELSQGGFHKAIYAIRLKFTLCAQLFSLIQHHVFEPYAQLIAFSPRFGCTLCFTPCAQLL